MTERLQCKIMKLLDDEIRNMSEAVYFFIKDHPEHTITKNIIFDALASGTPTDPRSINFDDNYKEGACLRVLVKGKDKFKYCAGECRNCEFYCNKCYKERMKGISSDLEKLMNGEFYPEDIRKRNKSLRVEKQNIRVSRKQNKSGSIITSFNEVSIYTRPYDYIHGYTSTYITGTRNVFGNDLQNRLCYLGVDINGELEKNVTSSIINDIHNMEGITVFIPDDIKIGDYYTL